MKIELAYAWTDARGKEHKPDAVVTVDEVTGRRLVHDGVARPAGNSTDKDGDK